MKSRQRILAMLLAGSMAISAVGCGDAAGTQTQQTDGTEQTQEGTATDGASTGADGAQADGGADQDASGSDVPLVVASDDFSEKFNAAFASSVPDQNVADLVQAPILYNDRAGGMILHGIEGETVNYNGTDYTYYGIADCDITENADGSVDYDITLKEGEKFSDGVEITADDLIFTYYVECDPSYDGGASLYSLPIKGIDDYRNGSQPLFALLVAAGEDNDDFTYFTEEQQTAFFTIDLPAAGAAFAQSIADYCAANGYYTGIDKIDAADIANGMANWGFAGINDDESITGYFSETTWSLDGGDVPTAEDFFAEMLIAYEGDVQEMSDVEQADAPLTDFLPDVYKNAIETGESATNIAGIVKTGDHSVRVTLESVDAAAIYQIGGASLMPMHYYGDTALYDYDNDQFGFVKGDLSSVRAVVTKPLGHGPYVFDKYENRTVYLTANPYYFKGEPQTKEVQLRVTLDPDKEPGIVQGTLDISDPSASKERLEQIAGENSNGTLDGDVIVTSLVDVLGYGYIGMNAQTVNVGGDGGSEASKDLRKAIATVLSVYRDVVIDSYYGDAASVINYPISNTSWAAPQPSDSDYAIAFSTDVNGEAIYSEGMDEEARYAAALEAALGYFEAAGYTVEDGRLTAAPEGAKLTYEVMIGGAGQGDHPSFGILTAASEALASIGFELKINDLTDTSILWAAMEGGTAEIWCAAWQATIDPDMYQVYHTDGGSSYTYSINDPELDVMIVDARSNTDQAYRKALYKECLDFIVDYAVEVPIYQRQDCVLFSAQRIDTSSVAQDMTTFYSWQREVENIRMR